MRATLLVMGLLLIAANDPPKDAGKSDIAKFDGEWVLVSGAANGVPLSEDAIKTTRRSFKDGISIVTGKPEVAMKAKFTIDHTKKPKTIDMEVIEGKNKGPAPRLGIYEFDGDTLKLNIAAPYRDRPESFKSNPNSQQTSSVWKRAPKEDKEKKK